MAQIPTTFGGEFYGRVEVSVVVVSWNRREMLENCLRTLRGQMHPNGEPFPHEVIVVDNGSADGTSDMVRRLFPEARLIRNAANEGFCRANNQGIAAARGRLIALLNNDAEADQFWLHELNRAFEVGENVGMAASKVLSWESPTVIDKVGHVIFADGQNRGRGTGELDIGQYEAVEEVLWPDGCAAMYLREMLERVGGFDEDYFAYADDADLGFRGRIAGYKCLYMPQAIVRHHRSATLGKGSVRRLALIERNRIYLAAKLFPWELLVLNPLLFALRALAGLLYASGGNGDFAAFPGVIGKLRVARGLLQGQAMALAGLPRMLKKRGDVKRYAVMTMAERRRLILGSGADIRSMFGLGREVAS